MTNRNPLLEESSSLADALLERRIGVRNKDLLEDWPRVVVFHLLRSRQALLAIKLVIGEELYGPAVVLCRQLFELAVNIRYLNNDGSKRLTAYLKHSRAPETPKESPAQDEEIRDLIENKNYVAISELLLPGTSWRNMKSMCKELGIL